MNTQQLIPLNELAAHTGGSMDAARHWIGQTGGQVLEDWAGRESVEPEVARRVVEAFKSAMAENARLTADYEMALRAWETRRQQVADAAYEKTAEKELQRQRQTEPDNREGRGFAFFGGRTALPLGPAGRREAQAVAIEAAAKFEKKNPRPEWDTFVQQRKGRR
jgi:hypothetical protein